jgi:hypothetical protein
MRGSNGGMFFRFSEGLLEKPSVTKATLHWGQIYGIRQIEAEMKSHTSDYFQYHWARPRKTWLDATCPVYIDFGDEVLIKLQIYDESELPCVRIISKKKFIHDAHVEADANMFASQFYPAIS